MTRRVEVVLQSAVVGGALWILGEVAWAFLSGHVAAVLGGQ